MKTPSESTDFPINNIPFSFPPRICLSLDRGATRSLLGSLPADQTREEETDEARGDEEDNAEDDDDACFPCGPVLAALGELVDGAGDGSHFELWAVLLA